jgi:hypothetical protein
MDEPGVTTIEIEARVLGRRTANLARHPVAIPAPSTRATLADLIEAVVRAEVADYEARAAENEFVRVLTEAQIADAAASGKVSLGGVPDETIVDVDAAIAAALLAHRDGLFQVVVDDEPVDDLDAPVELRSGTHLLFLRLVALAGG